MRRARRPLLALAMVVVLVCVHLGIATLDISALLLILPFSVSITAAYCAWSNPANTQKRAFIVTFLAAIASYSLVSAVAFAVLTPSRDWLLLSFVAFGGGLVGASCLGRILRPKTLGADLALLGRANPWPSLMSIVAILLVWAWMIAQPEDTFHDQGGMAIMYVYMPLAFWVWAIGGVLGMLGAIGSCRFRKTAIVCSALGGLLIPLTCIVPGMLRWTVFGFRN